MGTLFLILQINIICTVFDHYKATTGACPGFLKRGGGPISLGSLKKRSSDFKRGGGVQWSDGGGGSSTLVSLGRQILHIFRC